MISRSIMALAITAWIAFATVYSDGLDEVAYAAEYYADIEGLAARTSEKACQYDRLISGKHPVASPRPPAIIEADNERELQRCINNRAGLIDATWHDVWQKCSAEEKARKDEALRKTMAEQDKNAADELRAAMECKANYTPRSPRWDWVAFVFVPLAVAFLIFAATRKIIGRRA